ncbi:hypothetical protein FUAX_13510 [Fulvitalea axinellae]|uniref:DinB-like domain-containing protein n=1 Tax=Fulvitalea axinellae TaxID=1182444 RepID=A0AAU9CR54_9BACT|nr:hypothetical protein FUAX_13510 [Fulvitalea axinellae]
MKMKSEELLGELEAMVRGHRQEAEAMKNWPLKTLNQKPEPDKWSALESFEHLNRYGDFYLPEIGARINQAKVVKETEFRSGWLGNYFAKMMLPGTKKIKTFRKMDPSGSVLEMIVLDKFIRQQDMLLELLRQAKRVSLTKTKTSISISKLVKLKLGDTFRVVVYHNERHILQAKNAVSLFEKSEAG